MKLLEANLILDKYSREFSPNIVNMTIWSKPKIVIKGIGTDISAGVLNKNVFVQYKYSNKYSVST